MKRTSAVASWKDSQSFEKRLCMHLNGGQSGERKCLQFYKFKT